MQCNKNMRTFFKNIVVTVVLVLSLFSFETKGQIGSVYPVDLNVMLTPPYGTCLTDLSNSNRFVIQALLRDMNHGNNYEMLIQMRVKSLSSMNTVFLSYSNKFSIGMGKPAVVLGAGNTPVSISNFFESGNVLIGQNILNDNCLPEGAYLFCFQAFDAKAYYAKQRIPISKEFTVTAFLENGATPILISPANNDSLSCQLPNVIFQWQQPYITSGINSYTLQVAEANSPFDGPQIIENGGNLLIEKRGLMMPICDIPVTEANFKENHTYYWRVVMCDKDGKARASYPNKGASPVYKFVYCGTPQEPEPEDAWVPQIPMAKSIKKSLDRLRIDTVLSDESSCSAFWFQDPVDVREKYDGVVIEVKKKNQDTWTPFLMESKVATDTLVALSSLAYKETYMARGQYFLYEDGEKVYAPYSDTIEFKIPHPADTLECGNAAPELTDCTNAGERAEMEIGDVFNANGTTVSIDTITNQSVNGSSVIISGEGHLPFPILSKFGLKVSFDNIEINCADELKKGQVISVYDEKTAAMIDLNNILGKGAAGNDLKQEDASLTEVGPDDDLSGFKSGDLIVEDGKVSLIVGNGNVVQVGTVIDLSNSDAYNDNGALNDEDIYVKFSNPDHENIAFDDDPTGMIRRAATLSGNYVSFGEEYIIPWVATNPGRIFQLTATPSKDLSKSGFTDVKFVLPASGTHVVLDAVENGDGSYSVSIPGMKVDVQNQVYAIARKGEGSPYENVGKLNLCCYSYKSKKVVIVPLLEGLSVNTEEVKKDLDRVYAKLGYTFEVELDDDAAHREGLSTTIGLETDFLSDFSDEMKELIFNYEINIGDAYDKDAAYLFLLDKPTGKYKDAAGIMPQRQQYGFIFMREVTSVTPSITHTMAHELGHGIFGLDHIFSGAYGIKKGATYNLMDYTEKTPNDALSYHEWNQINLPLPSWSALSRVEDDMLLEEIVLMSGEFVWEGDWLCGYYPDELEEKVNDLKPLFDHIRNNYASYWKDLNSKKKDLDVDGFGEWSVRKFSIKEAICDSLYEKLSKKGTPSFDLHEKGIFLQPYVMNVNGVEKSYEVSVYSFKKNVEVDCNKFKLQDLSDLADHQNVKAAYCNEYGLVALYDEGKNLNMIIQVWSKDGESPQNAAINWLNYLNIVSQSGDADAKTEENKKQTDTKINESNPTGWSIDKCKQLVQRMYDNLSEWAKGLLPEEDLPVVWGEKLLADRYIVCDRFYLTSEGYLKAKINTVNSHSATIQTHSDKFITI